MTKLRSSTGRPPILFAGKKNGKANGLDFWENEPRPNGPALTEKSPHMIGKVLVLGSEYPVSVWVTPRKPLANQNGRGPSFSDAYLTIRPRGQKDASGNYVKGIYGYGHAQNLLNGDPFPEDRHPYVAAELTIDGSMYLLRGYISSNGLDFMADMGFTNLVEENARALLAQKEAAKNAEMTSQSKESL